MYDTSLALRLCGRVPSIFNSSGSLMDEIGDIFEQKGFIVSLTSVDFS